MAWIGETFGESFTSLKGQISKITKEVLAENADTDSTEEAQTLQERLKEYEALCASKDIEISNLRDENKNLTQQFQIEVEYLRNENKRLSRNGGVITKNFEFNEDQTQHICELENEISQLKLEKEQSLDDLQNEHQKEISQVIMVRDNLKLELKKLTDDYNNLKMEFDATLKESSNVVLESGIECTPEEILIRDNEILALKRDIDILHLQIKADHREKEESFQTIKKEIVNHEQLKLKLEKLVSEIDILNQEKHEIVLENKKVKSEVEMLKNCLMSKDSENNVLHKEKQELQSKVEQLNSDLNTKLSNITDYEVETQRKFKELLNSLNLNGEEEIDQSKFIDFIEQKWKNLISEKKELENTCKQTVDLLQEEITNLKGENYNLQKEIVQSQTDDAKRLDQDIAELLETINIKNNEIAESAQIRNNLEQELNILKSLSAKSEQELTSVMKGNETLLKELTLWKNTIENKEAQFSALYEEKVKLEEMLKYLENQHSIALQSENGLKIKIKELTETNTNLKNEMENVLSESVRINSLTTEFDDILALKTKLEEGLVREQRNKTDLENQLTNVKAQNIVKETQLSELSKVNKFLKEEVERLESESANWKEASVDLELQRQELEGECERLRKEDEEMAKLKDDFANLSQSYNNACQELEQYKSKKSGLQQETEKCESKRISLLSGEENGQQGNAQKGLKPSELKVVENRQLEVNNIQQHRRSKSDFDSKPDILVKDERLAQALHQEQTKYRTLQNEYKELKEKELNARRELERLRIHLVEVEDHYVSEAIENEKTINELKSKFNSAEEQLKNSSTIYKSANVRANQHLESLQSQIRLISVQRDDFQAKLSEAEDEIQKHNASLTSLQIVLEQFQQDKEREIEGIVTKYEYQNELARKRFKELETEIESMKKQISEAKTGLNAASRLGEQLERKSQHISELEGTLSQVKFDMKEMEIRLTNANQSNIGKIDKSLIKNLVVGYISSQQGDRRSQVLRIMASVLDFNQDERTKLGVDNINAGWLSNLLHPKSDSAQNTQSLSEAFIRFLENESRPQPQLKLLPEQAQADRSRPSSATPKSLLLSELMLPTFSSTPKRESSSILKDVLKDS